MTTAVWITTSICFTLIMLAIISKYDSPKKKDHNFNDTSCKGCRYGNTPIDCDPCSRCRRIFDDCYEEEPNEQN